MKVYLGTKGLDKTWQQEFSETTKCCKCKEEARIMFVVFEYKEKKYVRDLHDNEGKGGFWVHDAIACANYLCPVCFEVTAIMNQA